MNNTDNRKYDTASDENQGVVQRMAQAEEASPGIAQVERMNPVMAQGPEPVKEEVNDSEMDGVNEDILEEEEVEAGEADETDE